MRRKFELLIKDFRRALEHPAQKRSDLGMAAWGLMQFVPELVRQVATVLGSVAWYVQAETPLETAVLKAVRSGHFEQVIDFGAGNESRPVKAHLGLPAQPMAHPPNVNVAVIQLDAAGRMVDRAYVLLSRDYPDGLVVPLDKDSGTSSVRFLRWDIERSDGGTFSPEDGHPLTTKGWTNNPPRSAADDIVPGRTNAPYQFMAPYPASLFKSMIAFHVLRMVDAGRLTLDRDYSYEVKGAKPEPRQIRDWLDAMITVSDNHATGALLKMLHDKNEIESLNREFRELNLPTLQINATDPQTGRGWNTAQITVTAWDIARMFWLIAFVGNLGHRYADEVFASRTHFPAFDTVSPIAYTQRIPGLGKAVDDAVTKLSADRQ